MFGKNQLGKVQLARSGGVTLDITGPNCLYLESAAPTPAWALLRFSRPNQISIRDSSLIQGYAVFSDASAQAWARDSALVASYKAATSKDIIAGAYDQGISARWYSSLGQLGSQIDVSTPKWTETIWRNPNLPGCISDAAYRFTELHYVIHDNQDVASAVERGMLTIYAPYLKLICDVYNMSGEQREMVAPTVRLCLGVVDASRPVLTIYPRESPVALGVISNGKASWLTGWSIVEPNVLGALEPGIAPVYIRSITGGEVMGIIPVVRLSGVQYAVSGANVVDIYQTGLITSARNAPQDDLIVAITSSGVLIPALWLKQNNGVGNWDEQDDAPHMWVRQEDGTMVELKKQTAEVDTFRPQTNTTASWRN